MFFNPRKFAESKQKCTNIARKSCQDICENIIKDAYNPFCDGTTDPADTSDLFGRITFAKYVWLEIDGEDTLQFP